MMESYSSYYVLLMYAGGILDSPNAAHICIISQKVIESIINHTICPDVAAGLCTSTRPGAAQDPYTRCFKKLHFIL